MSNTDNKQCLTITQASSMFTYLVPKLWDFLWPLVSFFTLPEEAGDPLCEPDGGRPGTTREVEKGSPDPFRKLVPVLSPRSDKVRGFMKGERPKPSMPLKLLGRVVVFFSFLSTTKEELKRSSSALPSPEADSLCFPFFIGANSFPEPVFKLRLKNEFRCFEENGDSKSRSSASSRACWVSKSSWLFEVRKRVFSVERGGGKGEDEKSVFCLTTSGVSLGSYLSDNLKKEVSLKIFPCHNVMLKYSLIIIVFEEFLELINVAYMIEVFLYMRLNNKCIWRW